MVLVCSGIIALFRVITSYHEVFVVVVHECGCVVYFSPPFFSARPPSPFLSPLLLPLHLTPHPRLHPTSVWKARRVSNAQFSYPVIRALVTPWRIWLAGWLPVSNHTTSHHIITHHTTPLPASRHGIASPPYLTRSWYYALHLTL